MCGSFLSGVTKLRRSMDTELLKRVEDEVMPSIEELSLTVAGEPFLTPKLPEFVGVAERNGAELSLNTNATLLKDTKLLRRTMANARVIRFSVDGATAETYNSKMHRLVRHIIEGLNGAYEEGPLKLKERVEEKVRMRGFIL